MSMQVDWDNVRAKRKTRKNKKNVPVGKFGVDSGQVLIVDPCYLEEWQVKKREDEKGYTVYADFNKDGLVEQLTIRFLK